MLLFLTPFDGTWHAETNLPTTLKHRYIYRCFSSRQTRDSCLQPFLTCKHFRFWFPGVSFWQTTTLRVGEVVCLWRPYFQLPAGQGAGETPSTLMVTGGDETWSLQIVPKLTRMTDFGDQARFLFSFPFVH